MPQPPLSLYWTAGVLGASKCTMFETQSLSSLGF